MRLIDKQDATRSLGEYAGSIREGMVVITDQGHPVAALVPLENTDLETVELSLNGQFMKLIERSRASMRSEGGISSADIRSRIQ